MYKLAKTDERGLSIYTEKFLLINTAVPIYIAVGNLNIL